MTRFLPDLTARLHAAGDPLHTTAAEVLALSRTEVERLQERVCQVEAIARLNGDTTRGMQRAAAEIASAQWARPIR